jgi:hypothetical protein
MQTNWQRFISALMCIQLRGDGKAGLNGIIGRKVDSITRERLILQVFKLNAALVGLIISH